jgi:hypothetical protein
MDDLIPTCPDCGNSQRGRLGELADSEGRVNLYECDDCGRTFPPPTVPEAAVSAHELLEDRVLTIVCGEPQVDAKTGEPIKDAETGKTLWTGCGPFMVRRSALQALGVLTCPRCRWKGWPEGFSLYGPGFPPPKRQGTSTESTDLFGGEP